MENQLLLKQKRIMSYFIEAAYNLMEQQGIESLSIRKIAGEAGYNSATIYNYFEDLQELEIFASMRYLSDYLRALADMQNLHLNARQQYRAVYDTFNRHSFRNPEIFYGMFYGRYRDRLSSVISRYFAIYPQELQDLSGDILHMISTGNIYERDMQLMPTLIKEGFVKAEKADMVVSLVVRTHQTFLYDFWISNGKQDIGVQNQRFLELFDYILDSAK